MCLIGIVQKERPSESFVRKAWNENGDGGGVAWREKKGGKTLVHWKKGLNLEEMQKACAELPIPFVAHWRKKSIGEVSAKLCHPIPISAEASLAVEGTTDGHVLFHNGTWGKWDEFTLQAAIDSGNPLPPGKWNDTRALAWLAFWHGFGLLDIVGAKGIAFGTSDDKDVVFEGTGWAMLEGVWVSNVIFNKFQVHTPYAPRDIPGVTYPRPKVVKVYCGATSCTSKHIDDTGYCVEHTSKKKVSLTDTRPMGSTATDSTEKKGKNKISPCQEVVDELRGVARDKNPFLAKELMKVKWALGAISHSQVKKLTKEFDELARKRTKRQRQIEATFGSQVH